MKVNEMMVKHYIDSHSLAWASSTLRSEEHRLTALLPALNGDPARLWRHLTTNNIKPYARVTAWTRVMHFIDWALEQKLVRGSNEYRTFRKRNAKLFKNTYQPKQPDMTFEQAKARIASIKDEGVRSKATQLLMGALRYTESFTLSDGQVVGKGGKTRTVFTNATSTYDGSYRTFLRALHAVGLRPHDLRKIACTQLARAGLQDADLMKVMGWSSMATAKTYVQPLRDEAIALTFKKHIQGVETDANDTQEHLLEVFSGEQRKAS